MSKDNLTLQRKQWNDSSKRLSNIISAIIYWRKRWSLGYKCLISFGCVVGLCDNAGGIDYWQMEAKATVAATKSTFTTRPIF
jgi:hypothetical protein